MRRRIFVVALLPLLAIQSPSARSLPSIALTFAWPTGMTATIDAERNKTTVTPQGSKTESGGLRYRMRVSPHRDGRLVSYDNFEVVGVGSSSSPTALDQILSSLMPSLVVAKTGDFVRVGDLASIRTAMRQLIDGAREGAPAGAMPANLSTLLDSLSTEEVLSQLAEAEWEQFVGAYVGFSGAVGTLKTFDSEEPSPMVPGLMVPMRTTFGARQFAPCAAGRAADSCVVMQLRSVVAPGAMQNVVKRLLEGMKGLEGVKYESFDVTTESTTTLEPSTMRPHQWTRTRTAEFVMSAPGRGRAKATITDRRTYRITYR